MRRALGLVLLLALAGAPVHGSAQDSGARDPASRGPDSAALGADDVPGVDGRESPELQALRLAELELFGRDEALVELSPTIPRQLRLSVPEGLTSDAPQIAPGVGASGTIRDLSWLEGLTLPDIPVRWDERVIRYLEFFRDDPRGQQLIRSWMRRLDRFGPTIRRTLREQGLPEDLIYVAMIESGFDPRARSDAGAVGLWQFVSRTGAEYGLEQTHWVDLRMDPEASTIAGARYLSALQQRFGTWELAFASYNMGYGALLRSIRKYDTNDYWELSHLEAGLPFETSLYVSKVMACAIVGRNPERFGLADLSREAPLELESVEVPGGTALSIIARAAGTTVEELHRLNPALRRERVPPGREVVSVRIPGGTRETFARAWARARPRDATHQAYVVRFGEDLAAIGRRYRTTEAALRTLNELDESERVGPGFAMVVPSTAPRADERPSEPTTVAVPPGRFEYADRRQIFYRVQRRDELREIARFFRVTSDEIQQWNVVDDRAALQEGMFLRLFVPPSVDLAQAVVMSADEVRTIVIGSEEFYQWHVQQEGRVRLRYRVRAGDTLSEIASRFGLTTGSMARINMIGRDATLRLGQELLVYTTPERVPAELRESAGLAALIETPTDAPTAIDPDAEDAAGGEPIAEEPATEEVEAPHEHADTPG